MHEGLASDTAHLTARARAADAVVEPGRRLLDDRFAHLFVTDPPPPATAEEAMTRLRALDGAHGGFLAEILLRQRYFEDVLHRAVADGVRQVVLLGAGYDSTALRNPDLDGVRFFEVDHPSTQKAKVELLGRAGAETPSVTYVPVDFEAGSSLNDELAAAGYDASQRSVVGWLGVSFFLRAESFQRTLEDLAGGSAPGSLLVFDYMDEAVVDGTTPYEGALEMARKVGAQGEPYINGLTPQTASEAAERAGYRTVDRARVTDLVRRYGGDDPYCSDDDFMGLITAERL
ncbi:S-adenosyl-L-methionine-dependent methyltransferase [Wenjunlia tyrosinilytica]|uniref:S-adenosyl-L-methionine-dependent methyltransferase n=2 Tax=Wenjunlia tyrosinilytica TaxID=1544741 RepID=A0A917ZT42_9ACTN|nr:S-adenosyl-L-methionine-dependent methyltransferase [Wenjunlia tyrosinilytica]